MNAGAGAGVVGNRRSWRRLMIALPLLGLAVWTGFALLEAVLSPWARSLSGGPTLTGRWHGTLAIAGARAVPLLLELTHPPSGGCNNCPSLYGELRACEGAAAARRYDVSGHVRQWSGERLEFRAKPVPADAVATVLSFEGEWDGDQLRLATLSAIGGAPADMSRVILMQRWRDDARSFERGGNARVQAPAADNSRNQRSSR